MSSERSCVAPNVLAQAPLTLNLYLILKFNNKTNL